MQPSTPASSPRRRLLTAATAVFILAFVAAIGYWAGRIALAPAEDPLATEPASVTYEVQEQTIGRSQRFIAEAQWPSTPALRAAAGGVVTSVDFVAGDFVEAGTRLFSLDLRPVVAAEGVVPMFRDLELGDRGADVEQLQAILHVLEFAESEPTGVFDEQTAQAVRTWQESMSVPVDGVVRRSDVAFLPELPVRAVGTEALVVGASLNGGEVVIEALATAPTVVIPLAVEQRNLVPLDARVIVHHAAGSWNAVIARANQRAEPGAGLDLLLEAPEGGALCGESCIEAIPAQGTTNLEAEVVVVPETTGPVVPVAAIVTEPDGQQTVEIVGRGRVPIDILASTNGSAVVRGVEPGEVVVLPFADSP